MNPFEDLKNLEIRKRRLVWKPFMEKYDCQRICELGVKAGVNFDRLIAHKPEVAVAVDIWKEDTDIARNDTGWKQERLDALYEEFTERMKDKPYVKVIRDYTHDVAERFPDEYFDFVFIDADHSFKGVSQDIEDWYPKVKKGKFLFGHDFRIKKHRFGFRYGVMEAVTMFAKQNRLGFFVVPDMIWGIVK